MDECKSSLNVWTQAVRDVGFPIVVSMVLLYALLVRFPETFRQISHEGVVVIRDTVLQNRNDIAHVQESIDEILRLLKEKR